MEQGTTFKDLQLSESLQQAIDAMGFVKPSPIQAKTIPSIIEGHDVIGQAQTGTGKTAAFAIPTVEKLDATLKQPQAVILCPTRELAVQVAGEFEKLLKFKSSIRVLAIYGGQDIERQFSALRRGVQVVIATPGRLLDHLERKTVNLDAVKTVILDEADEMLDRGFRDDLEAILKAIPEERQTVFFSATMSREIMTLTKKYQKNPLLIKVEETLQNKPKIEQVYFEVTERTKFDTLCRLLDVKKHKLSLIFCRTKNRVNDVVERLQAGGYLADGLHGDMRQSKRDVVMNNFRKGKIEILVATDVAARGLDIENVESVYNYDMPSTSEYYTHRIGRTGRAGKEGIAIALISGADTYAMRDLMRNGHFEIIRKDIPTQAQANESKLNAMSEKLQAIIAAGKLETYVEMINKLSINTSSLVEIGAALLKLAFGPEREAEKPREYSQDRERSASFGGRPRSSSRGFGNSSRSSGAGYGRRSEGGYSEGGFGRSKSSEGSNERPSSDRNRPFRSDRRPRTSGTGTGSGSSFGGYARKSVTSA